MDLRDALTQITEIRTTMARAQVFRGYRAATTAFSAVVALAAAAIQHFSMPHPGSAPLAYVALWFGAAILCIAVVGVEMAVRIRRIASPVQRQLTLLAVEQFLPSIIAGGLLTAVFLAFAPEAIALLPGLWLVLFALGVFASCRLLPRATFGIGGFYLLAGLVVLILARGAWALHPLALGLPLTVGQFLTAGILYHKLERRGGGVSE